MNEHEAARALLQIFISVFVLRAISRAALDRQTREMFLAVWRAFRWWMIPASILTLATVVAVGSVLIRIPGLDRGWVNLLFGGTFNVVMAPVAIMEDAGKASGWNGTAAAGTLLFLAGFLWVIPSFAYAEEKQFRSGRLKASSIARSAVIFGLLHALMGIPPGWALSLSVTGAALSLAYRRAYVRLHEGGAEISQADHLACVHSACFHAVINTTIVFVVAAGVLLTFYGA